MKLLLICLAFFLSGCVTMQAGLDAMNKGDLSTAEQNFREALARGDTMAWNNLGVVYQRRGQMDLAVSHYTMAARWGHQIAQQNLIALGAPVPPADLAAAQAQRNAANAANTAATLQLMQALQPRPIPAPVTCNSYRYGNQVQTTCN